MAFVFLSYERKDSETARVVADALGNAGHTVWWDQHIKGGAQFSKEIERALERADAVVVLWSASSVDSAWVRDEAATGRDAGRLVPARIDATFPPLGFRQYQTIDLSGRKIRPGSEGFAALLDTIAAMVSTGERSTETSVRSDSEATASGSRPLTRRVVATGLATLGVAGAAGIIIYRDREAPAPPEVAALLAQAWQAWAQGTSAGNSQAIGLYRRATVLAPEYPDVWGFLGCAYADRAQAWVGAAEQPVLRDRARDAGRRALGLDPKNAYGRAAIAYAQPVRGNWLVMDREFRRALQDQPGKWLITYSLALLFTQVGRLSDAAALFGQLESNAPTATQYFYHIQSLWGAGRLDEAERLLQEASSIYGAHPSIRLLQFNMLMLSGRPDAAIALARDPQVTTIDLDEESLKRPAAVAAAMLSREPNDRGSVTQVLMGDARQSAWGAERAIQYAAALGSVNEAFMVAEAYYFSRGFAVPDVSASGGQPAGTSLDSRQTGLLFLPATKAMRADVRFERLVGEIGLARYWRQAGTKPDYLKA